MNRIACLLPAVACAIGCDAISHTHIIVRQDTPSSAEQSEVVRVTEKTATHFGLSEVERREHDVSFTDAVAGQNPDLWLTIKQETKAVGVEIAEMYISRPTDKHRQLADSLIENFRANGLDAEITSQTDDGHGWIWLIIPATIVLGIIYWRFTSRRRVFATEQSDGGEAADSAFTNG